MTEETHRRWDVGVKIVGFVGVIASALFGIYQYLDIRERELAQFADLKEREFYSQFWNERLQLYIKTLDAAAKISTAKSADDSDAAIRTFRTYFDGSMAVVQDTAVDAAMHKFNDEVKNVEGNEDARKDLGFHSYQLGRICYQSLKESWNKPFSHGDSKAGALTAEH